MLAIACALMAKPAILLLDEPSLGLAPKIVDEIFAIIAAVAAAGTGVLLVERTPPWHSTLAQHGMVLELGEVTLAGPARQPPAIGGGHQPLFVKGWQRRFPAKSGRWRNNSTNSGRSGSVAMQGTIRMREAFICAYVRTPIGRFGGSLSSVRADDLGAVPLKALVARQSGPRSR